MYKVWQINWRTGKRFLPKLPPLTYTDIRSVDKNASCICFLELPDNNMIDVGVTSVRELSHRIRDAQMFSVGEVVCLGFQLCKEGVVRALRTEILICFGRANRKHRSCGLLYDSPEIRTYVSEYCLNPQIIDEMQSQWNKQREIRFRLSSYWVEHKNIIEKATAEYEDLKPIYKNARELYMDGITLADTTLERYRLCARAIPLYETAIRQTLKWLRSYERVIRELMPDIEYPLTEPAVSCQQMLFELKDDLIMYCRLIPCIGGNPVLMIRVSSLLMEAAQALRIICQLQKDMNEAILTQAQGSD